jgi:hypothetical protein
MVSWYVSLTRDLIRTKSTIVPGFPAFVQNLPEYGFLVQNFWNNANQHAVLDPFGMVK